MQVKPQGTTNLVGIKVDQDIAKGKGEAIVRGGKKITNSAIKGLRDAGIDEVEVDHLQLEGAFAIADVVNMETGEVVLEANTEITPGKLTEDHGSRC
jgi:DNA-directed RNA polymerase subunit beta